MPLTPNFSASESLGVPENVTLTDTSTGVDATIVNRRVYWRLANGNYLLTTGESTTSAYENWSYGEASKTFAILTQSTTIDITVQWWSNSAMVYEKTILFCFDLFDYLFAYDLIGAQTSSPGIVQDTNYYSNFSAFIVNLFCAEVAVETGDDLYSSQQALNRNQVIIDDQSNFF